MQLRETNISGCYEILLKSVTDERGTFTKTFQNSVLSKEIKDLDFVEEYYSVSKKNVIRGMHFQKPPHEHSKLVYSIEGKALDVVVDLRIDSPTFQKFQTIELDPQKNNMLYIPKGLAHGFLAISDKVVMMYKVTSEYSAEHDSGILWSSVGYQWPVQDPIISKRDQAFVGMINFKSPFRV